MPLSPNLSNALGVLLWWPGVILGTMGGAGLLMSGVIPDILLDAVPFLGLIVICGGGALGAMGVGLAVQAMSKSPDSPTATEQNDGRGR